MMMNSMLRPFGIQKTRFQSLGYRMRELQNEKKKKSRKEKEMKKAKTLWWEKKKERCGNSVFRSSGFHLRRHAQSSAQSSSSSSHYLSTRNSEKTSFCLNTLPSCSSWSFFSLLACSCYGSSANNRFRPIYINCCVCLYTHTTWIHTVLFFLLLRPQQRTDAVCYTR